MEHMVQTPVLQRMRGVGVAPFAASVLMLIAAVLVAAFSISTLGPQRVVDEALRAREVAADIDRRLADAVMLRHAHLLNRAAGYGERSSAILSSLPQRIQDLRSPDLAGRSTEIDPWLEEGARAARSLVAALAAEGQGTSVEASREPEPSARAQQRLDGASGELWRDDGAFGALRRSSARWTALIDAELASARAQAKVLDHRLNVTLVGLIGAALLLTLAQGQDMFRNMRSDAADRTDALSRNQILRRDLAVSKRNLAIANERFDMALSAAGIIVFTQDADLRYQWVSKGDFGRTADSMIGASDEDLFGSAAAERCVAAKREALQTGKHVRCEVNVIDRGSPRWIEIHVAPMNEGVLGAIVDTTERRLDRESNTWLMRELSHRTQNLLAIVQSMARHTARTSVSGKQFISRFRDRLAALSAAHYLLVRSSFRGVAMDDLVRSQLASADRGLGERVHIEGPDLVLRPDAAQNLAMALSELASNALTHGALATPEGDVEVTWTREEADAGPMLKLVWQERPSAQRPPSSAPGFGSVIVTRMLPRSLQAIVNLDHRTEGTRCEIIAPLAALATSEAVYK